MALFISVITSKTGDGRITTQEMNEKVKKINQSLNIIRNYVIN